MKSEKITITAPQGHTLELHRFSPDASPEKLRPAIVFFHGGSWQRGSPEQMFPFARQFAEAGFVAYSAQYRLVGVNAETVADCVDDAHSVFAWLEKNALTQRIDPKGIHVGGGSAGGHLAMCVLISPERGGHSRPAGYFGFNPAFNISDERFAKLFSKYGDKFDPVSMMDQRLPPLIFLHGDEDDVVPIATVKNFLERARKLGTEAELIEFPGAKHGFFNTGQATPEQAERISKAISDYARRFLSESEK